MVLVEFISASAVQQEETSSPHATVASQLGMAFVVSV